MIVDAVRMQVQRLGVNSFVQTMRSAFVQQIEPAKDAVRMEEASLFCPELLFAQCRYEFVILSFVIGFVCRGVCVGWIWRG
jgi:hypothetical protein